MTCFRLRTYDQNPPGGFVFPKPGGGFWSAPIVEALAQQMSSYRKGNGKPRDSVRECLEDADHYQCQRMGNDPRYCVPCQGASNVVALGQTNPIIAPPCAGCGAPVQT
jgi:hypothetical protein